MSKFLDILKAIQLPPRFLLAAAALGLFTLLMPESWAQWLGIQTVLENGRGWIALGTGCAFSFGVAQLVPPVIRLWKRRQAIRAVINSLDSLSSGERILLGYCAWRNKRTVLLSLGSTAGKVAEGLCQKRIMEKAFGSQSVLAWPFTIAAYVWPEVQKRIDTILGEGWKDDLNVMRQLIRLDKQTSGREGAL